MKNLTPDVLTKVVHHRIKEHIKDIIAEEIEKANIIVGERINKLVPEITTEMLERVDLAIYSKQIIFTLKPKK